MLPRLPWLLRRFYNTTQGCFGQNFSGQSDGEVLRRRSPLILGSVLLGVIGTLYVTSSTILMNSFTQVEEQSVQENIGKILDKIFGETRDLEVVSRDYADWNSTYSTVGKIDQNFLDATFNESIFTSLNLNLVVFLNASNQIVFAKSFDLTNKEFVPTPKSLSVYLRTHPALVQHCTAKNNKDSKSGSNLDSNLSNTLENSRTGIVLLSEAPMLVAARPILTSQGKGTTRGTLLMGRYLNLSEIENLSPIAHLSIETYSLRSVQQLSTDLQEAYAVLSTKTAGQRNFVAPLTNEWIAGYTFLQDIDGNPALLLRVEMPRTTYQQGLLSLRYLQLSLLLVGLVFGTIIWLLLRHLVMYLTERDRIQQELLREKESAQHMAQQLSWQASYDALTGLVNRREFERRLDRALTETKTHKRSHSLCFLDLDYFKVVNDTCGHVAGDELLRQVSTLLQQSVRRADTVARLGGDEFAILLYQCASEQAVHLAQKICTTIQDFRFVWQDRVFMIGASIGLTAITADNSSPSQVLNMADTACYVAKNQGRGQVHVFQIDDRELVKHQGEVQWVTRINQALKENRLQLYYQTIASLKPESRQQNHYEVLLRLIDEQGAVIPAATFIPAAERYNLMPILDRWVIQTLFAKLNAYDRQHWNYEQVAGYPCWLYTINLSGSSLNDDQFIRFLNDQFAQYQIPPQMICFEITEAVIAANLSKATQFIQIFKKLGCYFALDDFGSGLSSFAHIRNLPVDFLKIDGVFVKDMIEDPMSFVLVQSINQVGQVMGIQTIAEFVINEAIQQQVTALGIDYAQGYNIAYPRPLLDIDPQS